MYQNKNANNIGPHLGRLIYKKMHGRKGQAVNRFYFREILERLRKSVVRVRPSVADIWMLHHDNAPCHMAISVVEFLTKKGIPVVPQPPYSPDLSSRDCFCSKN